MKLVSVISEPNAAHVLYALLKERRPEENISHMAMPSWEQHRAFVEAEPYDAWYLIQGHNSRPVIVNDYVGSIYGHGGSIREPYDTLRLYQSQSIAVPGAHAVNFSRWKSPEYDKIVDAVYITDPANVARLKELFRAAMEIWLPDLPDIQLVQNYHRIPLNTTYWQGWPTEENAYVNDASWNLTFPSVLWNLQRA